MSGINEQITELRKVVYNFFESRFTKNNFNINSYLGSDGYHMEYLGVEYNFDFDYHQGIQDLGFKMVVKLKGEDKGLEERVVENRVSNLQLDRTKYLTNQKIDINGNNVRVSCRLKRLPKSGKETVNFMGQLWGEIIQKIMLSVKPPVRGS